MAPLSDRKIRETLQDLSMITWHRFNPSHETSLLSGDKNYTPSKVVKKMMSDLELLPLHYAEKGGVVLSTTTLENFPIKIQTESIAPEAFNQLLSNKKYQIEPWGKAPDVFEWYRKQIEKLNLPKINLFCPEQQKALTSRKTGSSFLKRIIEQSGTTFEKRIIPEYFSNINVLLEKITSSNTTLLLKAPFSSSGRGLLTIDREKITSNDLNWIRGVLNKQGFISCEPLLDKIADFALEFYSDGQGNVSFSDYSYFQTDPLGHYSGNILAHQSRLEEKLFKFASKPFWEKLKNLICDELGTLFGNQYTGPLGIDMLAYQQNGETKIHPCVEINFRWTMGLVAAKLYQRYLHPESEGIYAIHFFKKEGEALEYAMRQKEKHPPLIQDNRIVKGFISLCPVNNSTSYIATLEVRHLETK